MTRPRLLIVADDLTGALDSACEAARRGIGTRVFLSPAALTAARGRSLPPVVAVSTGSRDGTAEGARRALQEVCAALDWLRPGRVMKKVDSRLKGHVALETGMLAHALGRQSLLLAPAIPDMGRVQRNGQLSGAGIAAPLGIAARFDGPACQGLALNIPDIASQSEMVAATRDGDLAVGARALAEAVVTGLWPDALLRPAPALPGPALFAIGSRDPVTLAQLARLDLDPLCAPDGWIADTEPPSRAAMRLVQMVPGQGAGVDPHQAGARFAEGLWRICRHSLPGTLIACGGETAGAVLARLGVTCLDVSGAALPGVPVSRAVMPDGRIVAVVTKSGGFGTASTLAQLAEMVDNADAAGFRGTVERP